MALTGFRAFIAILFFLLLYPLLSSAQTAGAAEKNCQTVKDYAILKKGQTGCISARETLTYLTLEGGTLIISGNARINNLDINKGKILVTSTGSAILPAMNFNGDVTLQNEGSITYMGNVTMKNSNNYLINASSAVMDWKSSELNFNSRSSTFTNNGTIFVGTLRLDSRNGQVILGPGSVTNVINLVNTFNDRVSIPAGTARMYLSGYAQLSESLTSTPGLIVCSGPVFEKRNLSHRTGGFGKATILEKGCTSFAAHP